MLNVFLKSINSAVKDRISEYAEATKLLPQLSFGFRKNHSAIGCVNYMVNTILQAKLERKGCIVVFMDISKAFDRVDTGILVQMLVNNQFPEGIVRWVHEYLRKKEMVINTTEGQKRKITNQGLPQGCPLSPVLFNLYTKDIHKLNDDGIILPQFADDFAAIITGDENEVTSKANNFIRNMNNELKKLNLNLNARKCAAINFGKTP